MRKRVYSLCSSQIAPSPSPLPIQILQQTTHPSSYGVEAFLERVPVLSNRVILSPRAGRPSLGDSCWRRVLTKRGAF